jgi:hypothetical protein
MAAVIAETSAQFENASFDRDLFENSKALL